jgi:hypothetical protein
MMVIIIESGNDLSNAVALPKRILAIVQWTMVLNISEDFIYYFDILWNIENVASIFVTEEIIEIVIASPSYRRKTERTGFMRGKKDTIF